MSYFCLSCLNIDICLRPELVALALICALGLSKSCQDSSLHNLTRLMLASHTQSFHLHFLELFFRQRRPSDNPHAGKVRVLFSSVQLIPNIHLTSPDGCPQVRGRTPEEEAIRCDSLPAPCPLLGGENFPYTQSLDNLTIYRALVCA